MTVPTAVFNAVFSALIRLLSAFPSVLFSVSITDALVGSRGTIAVEVIDGGPERKEATEGDEEAARIEGIEGMRYAGGGKSI